MNNLKHHIKALEEKLLCTDVSKNPEIIDEILAEDFEEIGSRGYISSRQEVNKWLAKKDHKIQWSLDEFKIRMLASDMLLANYRENILNNPNKNSMGSMRSSLWKKQSGKWQMIFHQGTKIRND